MRDTKWLLHGGCLRPALSLQAALTGSVDKIPLVCHWCRIVHPVPQVTLVGFVVDKKKDEKNSDTFFIKSG